MSVRTGMFPPPNVGAVPGQMQPAPNPFAPLPPMPLAGMPPPPMGGMPPPPMGGMQPPPMPMGPMGAGLGAPPSGQMPQQASNAPRRRQFGDYLESQLSGPSAPVQRSAPQNSFSGPMSGMDIFGGQPMPRPMQQQSPMPRPMMGGNMVQGYKEGGEAAAPTGVDKVLVEKYGYEFEDGKAYAPGKAPSALAAANPSGLSAVEQNLVGTGEWTDAGDGVIMSPGGLLYDHEAGDTFSDRLVSGLGADQLGSDVTEYMAPPDDRLSTGSVLQLVTGPNGRVSVVNTSGEGITFSDVYSGNTNANFLEKYSDYLTGDGALATTGFSYGTKDDAMAFLDQYGYEYGGNYVAPTPVAPAPVPVAAPVVPEPVVPVEEPVVPAAVDSYSVPAAYVPPSVSDGAPTGTYTAAPLPPNANETINYDQFNGDVGKFSNTGENFSLFGPKLNIPTFNSQYIQSPVTGNMTTTNGPNMTAVSGIGALNMPASPVDIDILDWLSQPSYGTFDKPANFGVQFKNQGGVVPRSTEIAGQPHMLAYINPEEEGMLQDYRQDAPTVPGPGGIPAYAHNAFHAADQASMASYNTTFADTPGTVANKNKVKEMQAKRRKERAEADARIAEIGAKATELLPESDRLVPTAYTPEPKPFYDAFGDSYVSAGARNSADMVDEIDARNAYRDIVEARPAGMSFGSGGNFYDPSRENLRNRFTQPIEMSSPSELPFDFDSERMLSLNDPMSFGLGTGVPGVDLGQSPSLIFPPNLDYRHPEFSTPDVFDPDTIRAETDLQREKRLGLPQYDTLQNDEKDRLLAQYRLGRMSDPTKSNRPGRQSLSEFVEGVAKRYGPDVAREMESEVRSDYTFGASPPGTSFGDPGFIPFSTGKISGDFLDSERLLDPSLYLSEPGTAVSMAEQMARRKELASNIYTGLGAPATDQASIEARQGPRGFTPVAANPSPAPLDIENVVANERNFESKGTSPVRLMGGMTNPAAAASISNSLSSGLGGVGGGDPYAPFTDGNVSLVELKNKISQAEGTDDPGGYDRLLDSGETGTFKNMKPLTEMTVGEAIAFAKGDAYRNYSRKVLGRGPEALPSTPMGKYQITGTTLQGLVDNNIIDLDAPFDADAQERLGSHLVMNDLYKGKGLRDFKTGKGAERMSEEELRIALGKQFEGMEGTTSEELLATAPSQRAATPNADESAYIQNLLGNFEFDENGKMIMADPGLIERVIDSLGSNFTLGQFSLSDYKRKGIQDALDAYKSTGEFVYDGGDLVGVRGSDGGVESYGTNIFETNAGDNTGSGGTGASGGSSGPDEVEQNWTIGEDGVVVCNDEGWIYDAETGMCAAPSADAGSGSESPSLNIPQARSFDDIMASISRPAGKISPISANIENKEKGGMAGLNKTADNFLRALGG